LLRFALVGGIGFALMRGLQPLVSRGSDPYLGRLGSYFGAATVTWAFNRNFTFHAPPRRRLHREWTRYVAINALGAAVDYAVYTACNLWLFPRQTARQTPALVGPPMRRGARPSPCRTGAPCRCVASG
jgi:putative flippase GtrA